MTPEQATEPLPKPIHVGFEFEVCDANYCVQATGSAPTYAQALSEGRRYLAQYLQDGPHTLEIRRVETFDPDDVIPAVASNQDGSTVAVSEQPWQRPGWCDEAGKCWWGRTGDDFCNPDWHYATWAEVQEFCSDAMPQVSLPHNALPLPAGEGKR